MNQSVGSKALPTVTGQASPQDGAEASPHDATAVTSSTAGEWHLYVLRTRDGALYTGIAKDVARRHTQHAAGRGAKSLRAKGPFTLVYQTPLGNRSRALRAEFALKQLSKADKETLVLAQLDAQTLCHRLGLAPD